METNALVIGTMVMVVAIAIAMLAVSAVIVVLVVSTITMLLSVPVIVVTMMFLVTRNVFVLIPISVHKVDPLAAGVVLAAMFAPVFFIAGGNVEIDRRTMDRHPLDYHWLTVEYTRRRIATTNLELSIEAGLADADGYADIGRVCRKDGDGQGCCKK
jgi:hypothetical protein